MILSGDFARLLLTARRSFRQSSRSATLALELFAHSPAVSASRIAPFLRTRRS
jgi:hypothetical protein